MRWRHGRRSSNIEDRRQSRATGTGNLSSLLALVPLLVRSKTGWLILAALAALYFFGGNRLFEAPGTPPDTSQAREQSAPEDRVADFVSVVLADTEDTWTQLFRAAGTRYVPPKLVLYRDVVRSACGLSSAAVGPFYCPMDNKVYLDLSFLGELQRLGAPGDFAFAYVIAHEVGHHVQNLLGISRKVQETRAQSSRATANRLSVMLELQADCFAGVWAFYAHRDRKMLEPGDLEEGLSAAAAVGDDRLQRRAGRAVSPDSFTHGSAKQRAYWFNRGFTSGDVNQCNTFAAP
ncbi:neutral zinc metallopeptidase [Microbulbifer thermotolerans]|uniref:Neutral zinc metallopeptidase n=1 Tax=Microbulbifer thermotolerans TaxID=252514 RepID=A0AB35HYC8_MICTH|nr:neutral zinc metallopeptidase [Microbulbifer thermotolerans]MCX2779196.1 neutral zinc metallopeptidase [Microbulbifer thermotolerans]MCX2781701.1 neutral zinc metallopeptidase [Microbulbifer thermotolerans]MCX2801557.1 neutral zinc metallopeptidase [Microbulbifer thermotolerans]MCX2803620.1 neutral zinc metallopeptidase [Microbulbifer thermotolerans]MCX2830383.1 neutral zinc metallopeptidase [Microbulbifer thermotolerans]